MTIRVAINGFGRIGRVVFRILTDRADEFEVVAINDLGRPEALAHLLKYDSTHGRFNGEIGLEEGHLLANGRKIPLLSERDPANLPWAELGHPMVVEATGVFRLRAQVEKHIQAGAEKVLLTVPPKDELDALIVMGVNDDELKASDKLVSNASCTTNCLAPMVKVLHEAFVLERGLMNTIHGYTNDQRILDLEHSDLRRARSAAVNIIPTTTGAARAVGKVMPEMAGKLDGFAVRVPVPDGSMVDLTAILAREVTAEEVNAALKAAAEGPMRGIIRYNEDPIVSSDIIGDPASNIFDAPLTMAMGNMVKVCAWYDNEWGYSARCADLLALMAGAGQSA